MSGIRVLVLDRQEVLRLGLVSMLREIDAVASCESADAPVDRGADVVIGSAQLVRRVPAKVRRLVVVPGADDIDEALEAGADGYLMLADLDVPALGAAVVGVREGVLPLPAAVTDHLLATARAGGRPPAARTRLSPREQEVLELVVVGSSNQEIADHLGLSIHGVKRHVSSILAKYGSPSRSHLVSRVLQERAMPAGAGTPPSPGAGPPRRTTS